MKKIAILGSTGSIGSTTLNIIANHLDEFSVTIIANYNNLAGLKEQIARFKPDMAVCINQKYFYYKGKELPFKENILENSEIYNDSDIVVNGIVGLAGLRPTLAILDSNAILATANKESFVCAGSFIVEKRDKQSKVIYPLDSEHNTVWQCIGNNRNNVKSIILTASGGAFRDFTKEQLAKVKAKDALKHPTWVMGKKVTIDCATLVNKGMEIIEAKYLFDCDNIKVLQHRESIIHSLVEMKDNSIIAGLSNPDMTIPIQYALSYPNRISNNVKPLDLSTIQSLNFGKIDENRFPCFKIAKKVAQMGDVQGTIFNSANEELVKAYLDNKVEFYDIPAIIENALNKFGSEKADNIENIFCIDRKVREYTLKDIKLRGIL
jgi:1-deoxy-D-xylulose-5-phosphate reductoisomerase